MGSPWKYTWDEAAIERLRVLWFGGFSASECGMQMGCSRNSIIGKIRRLGWHHYLRQQRPAASKALRLRGPTLPPEEPLPEPALRVRKPPGPVPKPKRVRLLKERLAIMGQLLAKPDPPIGAWTLMDLRFGVCKWPEGDRSPYRYCGDKALETSSYCAAHHKRAHQGPQHRALRPIESYAIRRSRQAA
jgi:hypothetical protein